jgi:SPP1 family predicted phage head-tail adaptor
LSKFKIKRHRITFQQPTETQDGTGQPVVTWSNFRTNEPADFTPTGGVESMRGKQLEAGTKGIFTVNYRTGYTTKMQIVHDGVSYGISHVQPVDGLRREIEIMVKSS